MRPTSHSGQQFFRPDSKPGVAFFKGFSMCRQLFGLVSLCVVFVLAGCGDKATVEPPDSGAETSGAIDTLGTATAGADSKTDPHDHGADGSHAKTGKPKPIEILARETLDGNWLLAFQQLMPPKQEGQELQAGEHAVFLFNVDGADSGSATLAVVAGRQGLDQTTISGVEISEGSIDFQVDGPNGTKVFEFSGKLKDGLVLGSTVSTDGKVSPVRLLPTDEKTFARIPTLIPLPEIKLFIQLSSSPVPDEDTRAFVEMIPVSPLGRFAYIRLINMTAGNKRPAEDLDRIIGEFTGAMKDWGEVAVLFAEFEAFNAVAMAGYDPEWCMAKADEMEKKLKGNETLEKIAIQIDGIRRQVEYRQTTELIASTDEADRQKARELAEKFLKESPFDPILSILMADDARENNRTDEAIRRYAELVAFPMQERVLQQFWADEPVQKILPTERLAKLWKEKNGGTDGLDQYIEEVYGTGILKFADAPRETTPEDAGKHVVLCELFTGARCVPCVAADVALEAIEKTYPQSQVITLRYHVHVPGHDPLTNDDAEARFHNYYNAKGTPSLFIDGMNLGRVAGIMMNAPQSYAGLRQVIDEFRGDVKPDENADEKSDEKSDENAEKKSDEKTDANSDETTDGKADAKTDEKAESKPSENADAKIDEKADAKADDQAESKVSIELRASRQQDSIQVSATVNGLAPETSNVRLMLALAESGIHYESFNGIRHHNMVVRQLIGGDRGTRPKDGALSYQGTVNVEKLRDDLYSYLTKFEQNQGVEFASKPLELKDLSVVAFVQDVETHKVLRTVMVRISGAVAAE
jgi:hypothetical protein